MSAPGATVARKPVKTTRRAALGSVAAAGLAYLSAKIYQYSAPPGVQKSCEFAYPPEQRNEQHDAQTHRQMPQVELSQSGGFINDASCLNRTPIFGIAEIRSIDDIQRALQVARENRLKVTAAGQRHSMGGQSFTSNGLVLDMRNWNRVRIDKQQMIANVQSGATWARLQTELDREALSVRAMQSINVFSIGGS